MTRSLRILLSYFALILAGCAAPVSGPGGPAKGAAMPGGLTGGSNASTVEAGGSGASAGVSDDSSGNVSSKNEGGGDDFAKPQGGIQSGSVAPTPDTGDTTVIFGLKPDRQDFFRGSRVSECSLPGGKTSVHVTGRVSVSTKGGPEQPLDVDESATLRICYPIPGYGNFECVEAPFDFPPHQPGSIQVQREPKNYVDATVTTTDPASLSYRLIFKIAPDQDDVIAQFKVADELVDASPAPIPACFDVRMQTRH